MDIMIYKCNAEANRLDKTQFLTGGISASATIKGTFRADAPELYLDYHGELTGYNYIRATINGIYMYYFARFSADTGQTVRASCSRDPLMSFASQILLHPISVTRCEQQATQNNPMASRLSSPARTAPPEFSQVPAKLFWGALRVNSKLPLPS